MSESPQELLSSMPAPEGDLSRRAYEWLLDPISPSEFESTYHQREFCVIARRRARYHEELLTLDDLDEIATTHRVSHPELTLAQGGRLVSPSEFTGADGRVDAVKLEELHARGATVVFNRLHRRCRALATFCDRLGTALSAPVQANAYVTPPGAHGFPPHWDPHDVFILQVAGTKSWTIFETTAPLPLPDHAFDPSRDRVGAERAEFVLRAGDTAYIPRGVGHAARAHDAASLHVTIAVLCFTWADALVQAVLAAARADPRLRESLPLGFARSDDFAAGFTAAYEEQSRRLADDLTRVSARGLMIDELKRRVTPRLGHLFDPRRRQMCS